MTFSDRLKTLKTEHHTTQKEIANAANITDRAYRYLESGKTIPNMDTLIRLADFYNVSIDYLVCHDYTNLKSEYQHDNEINFMNYKESLSSKLKVLRKENNLSCESLGKILGITNQAVSRIETGKGLPSLEVFYAIATYFNVSTDWLLGLTNGSAIDSTKK